LEGQTALVTGATRGIGEAIAGRLTDHGARVYAGARDTGDVTALEQRPVQLDVTNETQILAAVETISEESGRLDILVNNAGVYGPSGRFGGLATEAVADTLVVNLYGAMRVTHAALGLLTERPGNRVVNVSSGAGQFDGGIDASHLPYGVSKAGLNAFTNGLAAQYDDLLVNAVCPGWVRTDMGGRSAPGSVETGAKTPVWLARFREGPSGYFWREKERRPW
jgi:NAD(P)-dependent dehydrogenase (short-subunit alcohol dehydrogenase family)